MLPPEALSLGLEFEPTRDCRGGLVCHDLGHVVLVLLGEWAVIVPLQAGIVKWDVFTPRMGDTLLQSCGVSLGPRGSRYGSWSLVDFNGVVEVGYY